MQQNLPVSLLSQPLSGISFPVSALYVDAAKGTIEEKSAASNKEEIEAIWGDLQLQIDYIKNNRLPILEYYKAFLKVEPYCNYEEIKQRIQEEIEKNE